jgi:hypothetical protein
MIDAMWKRLETHQDFADVRGYGREWRAMWSERNETFAVLAGAAAGYQAREWARFIPKGNDLSSAASWAKCRADALAATDATEWVRAVLRTQQTIKRAEQDAELAAMRAIEWLDRAEGKT